MDVKAVFEKIAGDASRGEMVFPTHAEIDLLVRRKLDDPDCSTEQLGKLIAAEPILSAKVVAMANSVAYNPSGRGISDVRSAISRLGFNTLRTLVTALLIRQMQGMSKLPEHQALARRLWEHTAQVASLARVIARRVTRQDPEAAFFAGIVHEVGGFYLISRAAEFPELFQNNLEAWSDEGEALVGRAVLNTLGVPAAIRDALETLWDGYLAMPAESLGDTLLLADQLASIESPLLELSGMGCKGMAADINLQVDGDTLSAILLDSAEEVESLTSLLNS
ncbi:MAG: putative signal transduction protein [Proteobacteria bacterium]|nr:putative signal transduction protein [Pseudomonadota bacterium]